MMSKMVVMSGSGEIFLDQVREVAAQDNMGLLIAPTYFASQMSASEANQIGWDSFRQQIRPLALIRLPNSGVECTITPKSTPWGAEDVNIFAGQEGRNIYEIDDFNTHEGEAFLDLNFRIAAGLLDENRRNTQITIGFNPEDLSYGHHSVLKIHAHIRSAPSEIDASNRQAKSWHDLDRYDKLAFIEPLAPLYHDYIRNTVKEGLLGNFIVDEPVANLGYTSLLLRDSERLAEIFSELKALYVGLKLEYDNVAEILTDGSIDTATQRFVPRPQTERIIRLERFLKEREGFYSPESVKTLRYLAKHIRVAEPRDPQNSRDMSSTAMIYFTRGFAGGISFRFEKDSPVVGFDFMPFALTTSAVTKTMLGESLPTVIIRPGNTASEAEHRTMQEYHGRILRILREKLPSAQIGNLSGEQ